MSIEILRPTFEARFAIAAVKYRYSHEAAFPAQLHDARAVRYLRYHASSLGVDSRRFCAVGFSAGAHIVALLGLTEAAHFSSFDLPPGFLTAPESADASVEVAAVVAISTPTDLARFARDRLDQEECQPSSTCDPGCTESGVASLLGCSPHACENEATLTPNDGAEAAGRDDRVDRV